MKLLPYSSFNKENNRFNLISQSWGDNCSEAQNLLEKNFTIYKDDNDWRDRCVYVTIHNNNELIGVCEIAIYTDHIFICYIYSAIRQQGIATSMIKYIMERYPDYNVYRCYVRKNNKSSLNMFKKLGFEIIKDEDDEEFYELELKLFQ